MNKLTKPQQLWVEALRSGEFRQATEVLQDGEGGYCCLGVGCIVFEKVTGNKLDRNVRENLGGVSLERYPEVKEWLRLKSYYGNYVSEKGGNRSLAYDNDFNKLSFSEIANIIESKPEGLFNE